MTKELLRWEDSPGLEHHCPKCQTPLNNPRAKHTCYLKHVEICPLYHQHFFMIGQAHNCDTCRRFNAAHDQRHRALALLLRQFRHLQQENGIEPSACPPSPCSPFAPSTPATPTTPTTKRASISWTPDTEPETTPKLKKRERKKAKKRIKALKGGDALTTPEVAAIATALHPPIRNNSASSASSADTTATTKSSTSDQSTDNDDSMLCLATATPIPPTTPTSPTTPLTPITPITENTSFNTLMNTNKAFYPDVNGKLNSTRVALQTQLLGILDESTRPLDVSVSNALRALNIPDVDVRMPKPVVEMIGKIKEAVREDIGCAECDQKKYRLRQAGWYRFVNRSVLALREEE